MELTTLKYRCNYCGVVTSIENETDVDVPKSVKCKTCGRRAWLKGFGPSTSVPHWRRKQ